MSYRVYPYLTEDEMAVHQKEIRHNLEQASIEYKEMYSGSKCEIHLVLGKTNKILKFANYIVLLEVKE